MSAPSLIDRESSLVIQEALAARRRIRKCCKFCKRRDAKALCDWPVMKPVPVPVGELEEGDIVLSEQARKKCVVLSPEPFIRGGVDTGMVMYWLRFPAARDAPFVDIVENVGRSADGRTFQYLKRKTFVLQTYRPRTCDAPCCFACRRHVGPERDYCRDHWDDWETAERTGVK